MRSRTRIAAIGFAGLVACQSTAVEEGRSQKGSPEFSCYRHIRNTSGYDWTFSVTARSGNVYFLSDIPNCTSPNGPCTIPTGSDVSIQYTYFDAVTAGAWNITDLHGVTRSFGYTNKFNICPAISQRGRGPIVFNNPGNGDIHAWAPSW